MTYPHIPRVEIVTPAPDKSGAIPNVLTTVTVDGLMWGTTGYHVDAYSVEGVQTITLTFLGDVTIVHPEPKP